LSTPSLSVVATLSDVHDHLTPDGFPSSLGAQGDNSLVPCEPEYVDLMLLPQARRFPQRSRIR